MSSRALLAWLQKGLARLCPTPLLGVVAAGLDIELWKSAPVHWPHVDRAARLLQMASETDRLRQLANALILISLHQEETADPEAERELAELLSGEPADGALCRIALSQPLVVPATSVPRPAAMEALERPWNAQARVVALSARPGEGKSSLLAAWLGEHGLLSQESLGDSGIAGLFYWSFTHDPDVPSCLVAAAAMAEALAPPSEGGKHHVTPTLPAGSDEAISQRAADQLLHALARLPAPMVIVFDGLERLQVGEQEAGRPSDGFPSVRPGEIRDPQLRELLRSLVLPASGAVVLCTVERSIPSLQPFWRSGYACVELPSLSEAEGAELLRRLGAPGDEAAVRACLAQAGGHALTLDLLGRLAATGARPLDTVSGTEGGSPDSQGAFELVMQAQLQALSPSHKQLLALCALLPGPLREAAVAVIVQAGEAATRGVAVGASSLSPEKFASLALPAQWLVPSLRTRLDELMGLGLLRFLPGPEQKGAEERIDLHPLVRRFVLAEWCAARGGAVPDPAAGGAESGNDLDGDVALLPLGDEALDLIEQLSFVLVRAGHAEVAFALLCRRLGGFAHLVLHLGRPRRLLGLLRHLYPALAAPALGDARWRRRYALLLVWETESLRLLGQIEAALVTAQRQWPLGSGWLPGSLLRQARLHRISGRLQTAEDLLALSHQRAASPSERAPAAIELAALQLFRGDAALCLVYLREAELIFQEQPGLSRQRIDGSSLGAWLLRVHARRALRLGDVTAARALIDRSRAVSEREHSEVDLASCDVLLGDALRRDGEYEPAALVLQRALHFASRCGDAEVLVSSGLAQARLRIDTNSYESAAAALGTALALATEASLHSHRVDLLVLRGHLSLRRHDLVAAEQDSRDALALACLPGCGYAWGEADALHLLATTLLASRPVHRSPRHGEAVAHLTDELDLRERMFDPTAPEVRWLLRRLRA